MATGLWPPIPMAGILILDNRQETTYLALGAGLPTSPKRQTVRFSAMLALQFLPAALMTSGPGDSDMFRLLIPRLVVDTVLDLNGLRLREMGLDALLLDVDCTLKSYHSEGVSEEVAQWLEGLRAAGIGLCLVSNGKGRRIGQFAERLGLPYVAKACKPLPYGCRRALAKMGFDRQRTALVGDQLFADVMAANGARLTSILVRPIHPEEEPWFTRLKRPLERLFFHWLLPDYARRKDRQTEGEG